MSSNLNAKFQVSQNTPLFFECETSDENFNLEIPLRNIEKIQLSKIVIPNTNYTLTSDNNVLVITDVSGTHTLAMTPNMYYTSTSLATEIASVLNTNLNASFGVTSSTSQFNFNIVANDSFNLIYLDSSISRKIGLTANSGQTINWTGSTMQLQPQLFKLRSREISKLIYGKNYEDGISSELCEYCPNNAIEIGNYIVLTDFTQEYYCSGGSLFSVDLELYDDEDNFANLGGLPYFCTFKICNKPSF